MRNKAYLVAQGYTQVERIDYDKTFAPVARIESIRLIISIACYLKIALHQMDVKVAFLNGELEEEAYVEQPNDLWILLLRIMCISFIKRCMV